MIELEVMLYKECMVYYKPIVKYGHCIRFKISARIGCDQLVPNLVPDPFRMFSDPGSRPVPRAPRLGE